MIVYSKIADIKKRIQSFTKDTTIGFVPTMGALHEGHLSLIKKAIIENDVVVVSIFVNPTQFDKKEDLVNYPTPLEKDLKLLEAINCDIVFTPNSSEIYGNKIKSESFNFDGLEFQMEGKFRTGHFNGVGTIVKSLFEITTPTNAYFGEKDFQQLQIIKKLVEKHHFPINIINCEIFREPDGLAMSSRNARLTEKQRLAAPFIYKTLVTAKTLFGTKNAKYIINWVEDEFKNHPLLKLEYFEIADEETLKPIKKTFPGQKYRAFIAVFAGKIRLIDNIRL
jgi:pantoate--beta-alanine ligase